MFRGQGPAVVQLETEERKGTTLRPGASKSGKLARGCLSLPLCFQRKQRPSFASRALRFSVSVLRSFKCPLWWPWGCSEEGPQARNSRCRVDSCNGNLVKTRTPKAVNGDPRPNEPWPFFFGRFLYMWCCAFFFFLKL